MNLLRTERLLLWQIARANTNTNHKSLRTKNRFFIKIHSNISYFGSATRNKFSVFIWIALSGKPSQISRCRIMEEQKIPRSHQVGSTQNAIQWNEWRINFSRIISSQLQNFALSFYSWFCENNRREINSLVNFFYYNVMKLWWVTCFVSDFVRSSCQGNISSFTPTYKKNVFLQMSDVWLVDHLMPRS